MSEIVPPDELNTTDASGVPPATDTKVEPPLHIAAEPVIVAVGNGLTVIATLPDAACEQLPKLTVPV